MVYQSQAPHAPGRHLRRVRLPGRGPGRTAQRNVSTTPLQAFNLLNSPFILQQAERLARRIESESGRCRTAQVNRAFELVFQRPPEPAE